MTLEDHVQLRTEWIQFKRDEGQNLQKITMDYYANTPNKHAARQLRKSHLVGLLRLLRIQIQRCPEIYQDDEQYGDNSFVKWYNTIIHRIIKTYRYGGFCLKELEFEDDLDKQWFTELIDAKLQRIPRRQFAYDLQSLDSWKDDFETCNKYYNQRIWDIAEVFHYFHQIINEVLDSEFPNLYGEKFAGLRSWSGQEFLRMMPNKDILFHSQNAINNEVIKEHWSCNSLYRDMLVFKNPENFTLLNWYEVFRYNYRVVKISRDEDNRLNQAGFKSSRPLDAYQMCGINIQEDEIPVWNIVFEAQLDQN